MPPTVARARSATPPNDSRVWGGAPARSAREEGGGGGGGDAALPACRLLAAYSLAASPPKVTEPTKPAVRPLTNHPNIRQRAPQPRCRSSSPSLSSSSLSRGSSGKPARCGTVARERLFWRRVRQLRATSIHAEARAAHVIVVVLVVKLPPAREACPRSTAPSARQGPPHRRR
ncbi:hypothetical protein [Oryza sativa Japonica Group]|uniref:Uncharacterized protein n=1 Tax=Oryza sativa subsp. japonica TaxID=39947 RepID=Q5NAR3_ORYSJ|nr:hypothetical protein [Oryza sativa Japonica Group]